MLTLLSAAWLYLLFINPCYSDLHPIWTGSRALLLHHISPYSDMVTAQNSREFHAQTINNPQFDLRFAYPLQSIFFFAPLAVLPFSLAKFAATLGGIALTVLSLKWWTGTFRLDYALLILSTFPITLCIATQQPTVLFAALISAAFYCMRRESPAAAGLLLAAATAKPQLLVMVLLPVVAWVAENWKARKALMLSFGGAVAGMLALTLLAQPHWPAEWMHSMRIYSTYAGKSLWVQFVGPRAGTVMNMAVLVIGLVGCWKVRRDHQLLLTLSICTFMLAMPFQSYNEIMLIVPLLWMERRYSLIARLTLAGLLLTLFAAAPVALIVPSSTHLLDTILVTLTYALPICLFVGALMSAEHLRRESSYDTMLVVRA